MKVVQTNKAYFPLIGGMETTVANLSEGLSKIDGIKVEVLTCNNKRSFWASSSMVKGVPVTYVPTWAKIASLPISPSYIMELAKREGDILHIHEPFPLADMSVVLWPRIKKNFSRLVLSWHSDIVRQKWALAIYTPVIHRLLDLADCILVGSENNIESSRFLREYRSKCEIVPFGIKLEWVDQVTSRAARVKSIRDEYGTPLLLFVGRLVYYKGLEYLVEALDSLPEARLVIIGSGPLLPRIRKQIAALGLGKRITIIPHVPETELHAFYEACDIFVLPSTEVSEAFGLVQVEAMACGKPVVSTNLGTGVTFVNQNGVTGLTVRPRDSRALSGALGKLIRDRNTRESLGQKAKMRAFGEFSVGRMIERTVTLYNRLLA